jgi:hypothetical protein
VSVLRYDFLSQDELTLSREKRTLTKRSLTGALRTQLDRPLPRPATQLFCLREGPSAKATRPRPACPVPPSCIVQANKQAARARLTVCLRPVDHPERSTPKLKRSQMFKFLRESFHLGSAERTGVTASVRFGFRGGTWRCMRVLVVLAAGYGLLLLDGGVHAAAARNRRAILESRRGL